MRNYYFVFVFTSLFLSLGFTQTIHRMEFDRFTHYHPDDWITFAPATHISSIDIGDVYVYFATRGGGILRYDSYRQTWEYPLTTSQGLRSNHIQAIVYDYLDTRLYALHEKGIDSYDRALAYWEPTALVDLPPRRVATERDIQDFMSQSDFRFPEFYRPSNSELPHFFTDTDYLYRPPGEVLDNHNRIFRITDRVVDRWRNLWLGTNGLGVARANLDNINLDFYPQSISNISPRDIEIYDRVMWIGGINSRKKPGGITRWDLKKDRWDYFEAPLTRGVYNDDILVISSNDHFTFLGAREGLIRFDKMKNRWKTFTTMHGLEANHINDLFQNDSILIIATEEGFNWMLPPYDQINESKDLTLDGVSIRQICWLDSLILFSTPFSLYQYDPEKDEISAFQIRSALPEVEISAIDVFNDTLWVCQAGGVAMYDKAADEWRSYTQIGNNIDARFHDIAFTEGHVWFATDKGLLKYNKKMDHWYLYTSRDGLADNQIFHIDVDGDLLWLSTKHGITRFVWDRPGRIE